MKKIAYVLFLTILLFLFTMSVSASEIIVITGYDIRFRSEASTSSNYTELLGYGTELNLLDANAGSENGCSNGIWYKGEYNGQVGYVCSLYAKIETVEDINPEDYAEYSDYLRELGFPEPYVTKLTELHIKHPKWDFNMLEVDVDFNTLIQKEYDGYVKGWSLIEDTGHYYDGYKSLDSWSYNYLTDVFSTDFRGGGSVWYAASKQTIAYYVDPRNFLDEVHVFMFENLGYNSQYHTREGVEIMLKGTFMENGYADVGLEKTYVDAFMDAATMHNVSPYVLVSRVIQEIGAKGSTIVSGTVSGYEGYYNFYNIKAAGTSASETISNGLAHAVKKGWNTRYKAIVGGASFLSDDYFDVGQDTLYLQKWDIIGDTIVKHQYMQNIQAPYHESVKTFNGYSKAGLLDSEVIFTIPVLKNMPEETKLPNKGNPNNYLLKLSINGNYLFEEATTETEFNYNLDENTTSIEIATAKVSSKSTVAGQGTVAINSDSQVVPIVVTAQNGDIRTYNINITRDSSKAIAVSEILRTLNIRNDGTYIYGYELGTDISSIKKNIIDKEPKAEVTSTNIKGELKTNGIIATGDKIKIKTSTEEKEYSIVILGDVNSDGKIDKVDAAAILRYFYKYTSYDGAAKVAADVTKDGNVNKVDVAAVLRNLYGYDSIKQ